MNGKEHSKIGHSGEHPLRPRRNPDHFTGCLLGGAVGDALGAPVEFMSLADIRASFGPAGITDFAEAYGRIGAITDDTQMTIFTAEGLLRAYCRWYNRGIVSAAGMVCEAYLRWLQTQGESSANEGFSQAMKTEDNGWLHQVKGLYVRRAPGSSCLSALRLPHMGTLEAPPNDSKGCGAVMRMAPVGLFFWNEPARAFDTGCEFAAITHGHASGYLAAGCLATIISEIIAGATLHAAIERTLGILATKAKHEECSTALERAVALSAKGAPSPQSVESLGEGWIAEEAMAIAVYCALVFENDFSRGVLLAVNHGGDSDSTGSIAGNILGALGGKAAIPTRWLERLELREEIEALANDLFVQYRNDRTWRERYPGG